LNALLFREQQAQIQDTMDAIISTIEHNEREQTTTKFKAKQFVLNIIKIIKNNRKVRFYAAHRYSCS
jgi:hypothetical protein